MSYPGRYKITYKHFAIGSDLEGASKNNISAQLLGLPID